MIDVQDYQGCKTIIYDEATQSVITEGTIENFEKNTYTVTLRSPAFLSKNYERVNLLIFYQGVPHEYKGTVRKTARIAGMTEIALYRGKINEKRNAVRYPLSVSGVIEHFIIVHKLVPLYTPMQVEILNISTNGCLLRGKPNVLNINTAFQLSINMHGTDMLVNAKVTRIRTVDSDTVELGCKLLFSI